MESKSQRNDKATLIIECFRKDMGIHHSFNIQDTLNFQDIITEKHEKAVKDFVLFLDLSKDILGFSTIQIRRDKRKYRSEYP